MQDPVWQRLRQMGYGGTPPIVPQGRQQPVFVAEVPMGMPAPRTRRAGGADAGTLALALSGVSLYWTLPMMLASAGRRSKRARRRPRT